MPPSLVLRARPAPQQRRRRTIADSEVDRRADDEEAARSGRAPCGASRCSASCAESGRAGRPRGRGASSPAAIGMNSSDEDRQRPPPSPRAGAAASSSSAARVGVEDQQPEAATPTPMPGPVRERDQVRVERLLRVGRAADASAIASSDQPPTPPIATAAAAERLDVRRDRRRVQASSRLLLVRRGLALDRRRALAGGAPLGDVGGQLDGRRVLAELQRADVRDDRPALLDGQLGGVGRPSCRSPW